MGTLGGTHSYSYDSTYQLKTASYPGGYFASNSVFNLRTRKEIRSPGTIGSHRRCIHSPDKVTK